jgi:hypothetical protein
MSVLKDYQPRIGKGYISRPVGTQTSLKTVPQLVRYTAYARYDFSVDGGTQTNITPATTDLIPSGALVDFATANSTTAVTGAGSSVSIGTSAGSSTTSILTTTARTALTLDAVIAGTCVATPFKMSAAGSITFTISGANVTAGVIEVQVGYWMPANA